MGKFLVTVKANIHQITIATEFFESEVTGFRNSTIPIILHRFI